MCLPSAPARWIAQAKPVSKSHRRSEAVPLLPGTTMRSAPRSSSAPRTKRTATPGSAARGSKSSKLEMSGSRTTATSRERHLEPPGRAPAGGLFQVERVLGRHEPSVEIGDDAQHRHPGARSELG